MKYLLPIFFVILSLVACSGTVGNSPTPSAKPPITDITLPFTINTQSLHPFHQADGLFSINVPADWQPFNQPYGVIFLHPGKQAAYGVLLTPTESVLAPQAVSQLLEQFVQTNYGKFPDFRILAQDPALIRFKYLDDTLGSTITQIAAFQQNNLVYFTQISLAEPLFDQWLAPMQTLVDTLQLNPGAYTPPVPTPTALPVWNLYTHPEQGMVFLYPDNWVITTTQNTVLTTWSQYQFSFAVEVIPSPGIEKNLSAVELFTRTEADRLADKFADWQSLPVTTYQAEGATGYTFDYLHATATGVPQAGSVMVLGKGDKLYRVEISAPAPAYDLALTWFNPMLQSFKVLDKADMPPAP